MNIFKFLLILVTILFIFRYKILFENCPRYVFEWKNSEKFFIIYLFLKSILIHWEFAFSYTFIFSIFWLNYFNDNNLLIFSNLIIY